MLSGVFSLDGPAVGARATPMESEGGLPFDQVAHPKPGDWPTYHGGIGGNRYSALDQINASNVRNLAAKWVFPINHFALEVTPVVVDGVMFVTGPNQVFALDAQSEERSGTISGIAPRTLQAIRLKVRTGAWRYWATAFYGDRQRASDRASPRDRAVVMGRENA